MTVPKTRETTRATIEVAFLTRATIEVALAFFI